MRVNKNNGNVLRTAKYRLVSVSDGPRRGKAVFGRILCWPCRVFCAVNKYVQAFVQGEGPGCQQAHAHIHGRGAPGPPGLLGNQPSGPPNALGHGKRGGMCKFARTAARRLPTILPPYCLAFSLPCAPGKTHFQNNNHPKQSHFTTRPTQFPSSLALWPLCRT